MPNLQVNASSLKYRHNKNAKVVKDSNHDMKQRKRLKMPGRKMF